MADWCAVNCKLRDVGAAIKAIDPATISSADLGKCVQSIGFALESIAESLGTQLGGDSDKAMTDATAAYNALPTP